MAWDLSSSTRHFDYTRDQWDADVGFRLVLPLERDENANPVCNEPMPYDIPATSETWTDPSTGLIWQNPSAEGFMTWEEAKDYADNLVLGGYDDWRLPTISELRSLIRGNPNTVTGGPCGVTDSKLPFSAREGCTVAPDREGPDNGSYWPEEIDGICGWYWSSSPVTDTGGYDLAWAVYFRNGYVNVIYVKNGVTHVRCVR